MRPYCKYLKSDCTMPAYAKCERCPEIKTTFTQEQIDEDREFKRLYSLAYAEVVFETGPIRTQEHVDRVYDLIKTLRKEGR